MSNVSRGRELMDYVSAFCKWWPNLSPQKLPLPRGTWNWTRVASIFNHMFARNWRWRFPLLFCRWGMFCKIHICLSFQLFAAHKDKIVARFIILSKTSVAIQPKRPALTGAWVAPDRHASFASARFPYPTRVQWPCMHKVQLLHSSYYASHCAIKNLTKLTFLSN